MNDVTTNRYKIIHSLPFRSITRLVECALRLPYCCCWSQANALSVSHSHFHVPRSLSFSRLPFSMDSRRVAISKMASLATFALPWLCRNKTKCQKPDIPVARLGPRLGVQYLCVAKNQRDCRLVSVCSLFVSWLSRLVSFRFPSPSTQSI